MKLYQHSVHCPVAIQRFLDANPKYWPFIPLPDEFDDRQIEEESTSTIDSLDNQSLPHLRSNTICARFVSGIPRPPIGYQFSRRQRSQQVEFFRQRQDQTLPDQETNLYDTTVLAVCK